MNPAGLVGFAYELVDHQGVLSGYVQPTGMQSPVRGRADGSPARPVTVTVTRKESGDRYGHLEEGRAGDRRVDVTVTW